MYRLRELILNEGENRIILAGESDGFAHLITDARNILYPGSSLFFAIKGQIHDGHQFVSQAYQQGVRNFVVSDALALSDYHDANAIVSQDVVGFMQRIATMHRDQFERLKVIGITGSNGKTVVKEWLSSLLSRVYATVKTPKSYNSQLGVALSVWGISADHEMAVLEAGISLPGEMSRLEKMIKPDIGVFTNLGDAHDVGFNNREQKLQEKLLLFKNAGCLVYNGDDVVVSDGIKKSLFKGVHCNWGYEAHNALRILNTVNDKSDTLSFSWRGKSYHLQLPNPNKVFFENAMHCICAALWLNVPLSIIEDSVMNWQGLEMR